MTTTAGTKMNTDFIPFRIVLTETLTLNDASTIPVGKQGTAYGQTLDGWYVEFVMAGGESVDVFVPYKSCQEG